jgi:hypothetical protein
MGPVLSIWDFRSMVGSNLAYKDDYAIITDWIIHSDRSIKEYVKNPYTFFMLHLWESDAFLLLFIYSSTSELKNSVNGGQNNPRRLRVDTRGTATWGLADCSSNTTASGEDIEEEPGAKVPTKKGKGVTLQNQLYCWFCSLRALSLHIWMHHKAGPQADIIGEDLSSMQQMDRMLVTSWSCGQAANLVNRCIHQPPVAARINPAGNK